MRYELLLQSTDPAVPYDPTGVEAALLSRGVTGAPEGSRSWRLQHGDIEVRPLMEGGRQVATELRVPLSDRLELIREVVVEGSALAGEAKVRLLDPQLGRELSARDDGPVADHYLRTARYAGEMLGISEAIGASIPPPEEGLKPGTKLLLGVIGALILLYLFVEKLLG